MDEKIENCAPPGLDAKIVDRSSFEIIAVSDYEAYFNGSVKYLRNLDGIIPFHAVCERFDRGQWHVSVFNAHREDFCKAWQDPKEVWYTKMKRLKSCPLEVGDEWNWDMEPVFDFPIQFSSYLVGKWRATMQWDFKTGDKMEVSCFRFFADIVEM